MVSVHEGRRGCHIGFYLSFVTQGSHGSFPAWRDVRMFAGGPDLCKQAEGCQYHEHFYSDHVSAFTKGGYRNGFT